MNNFIKMSRYKIPKGIFSIDSPYLLMTPILLILFLVILVPGIWAIILSFTKYEPGGRPVYIGLKNYVEITKDPLFLNALFNNIIFLAAVIFFEFLVGFGSALLLNHKFPLQKLWVSLVITPYAISPVISCVIWRYMLNPNYGIVNYTLSFFNISPIPWFGSAISSFIAVIIVDVWIYSPFIFIIAYSALISLPLEFLEASKIDGATSWQEFRFIVFPLIRPSLLIAVIFRIIFALRTFGIIWILTGGGPGNVTEILSIYLYKQAFRYLHYGKGAAVALFMLIITAVLSINIVKDLYKRMF